MGSMLDSAKVAGGIEGLCIAIAKLAQRLDRAGAVDLKAYLESLEYTSDVFRQSPVHTQRAWADVLTFIVEIAEENTGDDIGKAVSADAPGNALAVTLAEPSREEMGDAVVVTSDLPKPAEMGFDEGEILWAANGVASEPASTIKTVSDFEDDVQPIEVSEDDDEAVVLTVAPTEVIIDDGEKADAEDLRVANAAAASDKPEIGSEASALGVSEDKTSDTPVIVLGAPKRSEDDNSPETDEVEGVISGPTPMPSLA